MNDDPALAALRHRLAEVRDSLDGEHMTIPASEIFARDRRHRARRWVAAAGAGCAAIGLAVALTLALGSPARTGGSVRPGPAQLAAWTVQANPDGTVTFTLRNTSHPAQLQRALARAGVPAAVRWGEICQARGPLMSTAGFVQAGSAPGVASGIESWFALQGGSAANPDLGWSWTVTPGKIPHGGRFVISAVPGNIPATDIQALWEFARTSALTCARLVKA